MSTPNLDSRYITPTQVDAKIATQATTDAGQYVTRVTGLSSGAGADNTAAINAAISAVNSGGGGGVVLLPKGSFPFAGVINVGNGIILRGSGNSGSGGYGGTRLTATASAAQVFVAGNGTGQIGYGGGVEDLEINGASVSTNPMHIGLAVDRTFKNVDVHHAVQDNWLVEYAQNSLFISCTANNSGRHGITIDNSAGGLLFQRFNVSSPGQHAVNIVQSTTAANGAYAQPTQITFETCVFERPVADYSLLYIYQAMMVSFSRCMISPSGGAQTSASAFAELGFAPFVTFDTCYWAGTSVANQPAIRAVGGFGATSITIIGTQRCNNLAYFFDIGSTSGSVSLNAAGLFLNGAQVKTAGTPTSSIFPDQYNSANNTWSATSKFTGATPNAQGAASGAYLGVAGGFAGIDLADGTNTLRIDSSTGTLRVLKAGVQSNFEVDPLGNFKFRGGQSYFTAYSDQTASYTVALADTGVRSIRFTASGSVTATIPLNSAVAYPLGTTLSFLQNGVGQVTVAGASGVTLLTAGTLQTRAQYAEIIATYQGSDKWIITGDMA